MAGTAHFLRGVDPFEAGDYSVEVARTSALGLALGQRGARCAGARAEFAGIVLEVYVGAGATLVTDIGRSQDVGVVRGGLSGPPASPGCLDHYM